MNNYMFREKDFISLLFHLLYQKGITTIDENKLKKKLYYYKYENLANEVFQDIVTSQVSNENEVNISQGLYFEKFFGGHIQIKNSQGILTLNYCDDLKQIKALMAKLSEVGQMQMLFLADSLSKQLKLEKIYPNLDFYYTDANRIYYAYRGLWELSEIERNVLTDGQINRIEEVDKMRAESLRSSNIIASKILKVLIMDASFVILQDKKDDLITKATIYTKENEDNILKRISEIATAKFDENKNDLQMVRKIALK